MLWCFCCWNAVTTLDSSFVPSWPPARWGEAAACRPAWCNRKPSWRSAGLWADRWSGSPPSSPSPCPWRHKVRWWTVWGFPVGGPYRPWYRLKPITLNPDRRNPPVPGQDIHEGGLSGSWGPHDGHQVPACEFPRDPFEQSFVTWNRTVRSKRFEGLIRDASS